MNKLKCLLAATVLSMLAMPSAMASTACAEASATSLSGGSVTAYSITKGNPVYDCKEASAGTCTSKDSTGRCTGATCTFVLNDGTTTSGTYTGNPLFINPACAKAFCGGECYA